MGGALRGLAGGADEALRIALHPDVTFSANTPPHRGIGRADFPQASSTKSPEESWSFPQCFGAPRARSFRASSVSCPRRVCARATLAGSSAPKCFIRSLSRSAMVPFQTLGVRDRSDFRVQVDIDRNSSCDLSLTRIVDLRLRWLVPPTSQGSRSRSLPEKTMATRSFRGLYQQLPSDDHCRERPSDTLQLYQI